MEPAVRNYFLSPISLLKSGIVNKKTDLLGSILLFTIGSPDGDRIRDLVEITTYLIRRVGIVSVSVQTNWKD